MTPRLRLATAALGAAVFLAAAPSADACSCIPTGSYPTTVCQAYVQAQMVFAGRVLSITPHPTLAYHNNVRFSVSEGFKNATTGTEVTVPVPINSGICGKSFTVGTDSLYYGGTMCGPGDYTKPLANAGSDITILRSGQCANVPPAPTGLTAQAGRVDCDGSVGQPVVLSWNAAPGAASYIVRKFVAGSWTPIASGIGGTTYSISAYQTATYAVSAVGTGGEGPRTNGVQGTVLVAPCPSPTARPRATPTATVRSRPTATVRPTARPTGATWQPGVFYSVGSVVSYGSGSYRCIQAHTSQTGWEPPNVPALWSRQ
jgi:hypothetical protein